MSVGKPATDSRALKATSTHIDIAQKRAVHALTTSGNTITIRRARDGGYFGTHVGLINNSREAELYTIAVATGDGYAFPKQNGKDVTIYVNGDVQITSDITCFTTYSITYSS
jgi:hypothetical protein